MRTIKVNRYLLPVLAVATLLGSVWVAKAAGVWQTSGRGQILLDSDGRPDPAGIKGWMTLTNLSETYGVPLEALYVMIGAQADVPAGTALKDLEKLVPGMEVWAVRFGVAAYLDGSWTAAEGRYGDEGTPPKDPAPTPTPLPTPTATVEAESVKDHVPRSPAGGSGQGPAGGSGQGSGKDGGQGYGLPADGSRLPGSQIKGWMTVQEVVDHCQVPLEYLVSELGLAEEVDTQLRMRELASQLGVEVLTVREVVERYQVEH